MENEELFKSKKRQIWQRCIITILAFFIVIQFSLIHCNNQVLVNQFSFASTISSIILSVIAIIMTVVSNDSVNNLLHRFRDFHDDIKNKPKEIDLSVEKMVNVTTLLNQSIENSNVNVSQLGSSVSKMNHVSDSLEKSVNEVNEATNNILSYLQKLSQKIETGFRAMKYENGGKTSNEDNIKELYISEENLINYSSTHGLYVIYAAALAQEKKKKLSLAVLSETLNSVVDYLHGYLIAVSAIGFIIIKSNDKYNFEIAEVKKGLMIGVKEEILKRFSDIPFESMITQIDEIIDESAPISFHEKS